MVKKKLRFGMVRLNSIGTQTFGMKSKYGMTPITLTEAAVEEEPVIPITDAEALFALYDVIVVASLDQELSTNAEIVFNDFLELGGSILWINESGFSELQDGFTGVTSNIEIDALEGFTAPDAYDSVTHELLTGITAGSSTTFTFNTIGGGLGNYGNISAYTIHSDGFLYAMGEGSSGGTEKIQFYKNDGSTWTDLGYIQEADVGDYYARTDGKAFASFNGKLYAGVHIDSSRRITAPLRIYSSTDGTDSPWTSYFEFPTESGWWVYEIMSLSVIGDSMYAGVAMWNSTGNQQKVRIYSTSDGSSWSVDHDGTAYAAASDSEKFDEIYDFIEFDGDIYAFQGYSDPQIIESDWAPGPYSTARILKRISLGNWSVVETFTQATTFVVYGQFAVFRNRLFLFTSPTADIFVSDDGSTWSAAASIPNRMSINGAAVMDNKLYITVIRTPTRADAFNFYSCEDETGVTWTLEQVFGSSLVDFPDDAQQIISYKGKLYTDGFGSSGPRLYDSDFIAPVFGDNFVTPTDWLNKGSDLYDPDAGIAILYSWRLDSDWIALCIAYETDDEDVFGVGNGTVENGRYCHVGDSNLFSNALANFDRGSNTLFRNNVFTWLGKYVDSVPTRSKILWIVEADAGTMDTTSVADSGASDTLTYLEGEGFTVTQVLDSEVDSLIDDLQ